MTVDLINIYFVFLIFAHTLFLLVIVYNFFTAPRLMNSKTSGVYNPFVSVLIPARNEENNISACLSRLINSSYKNLEIKVLDDESNDRTAEIVKKFEKRYKQIKLINGIPLPHNWLGKNWACHQLANHASGELLLFLDSDVVLSNEAIQIVVDRYNKANVKMLSVFPTQILKSVGEWFVVPLMDWLLLTFLPLKKVNSSNSKYFAAANGQFILFDRDKYIKYGGHAAVKNEIVEDMELVRKLKSAGEKTITLLGNNIVLCRMYQNLSDSIKGYTKNFFPGFKVSGAVFLLILFLLEFVFLIPFFLVFVEAKIISILSLIIIETILLSMLSKQNVILRLLFFIPQKLMLVFIGVRSLLAFHNGSIQWKDRTLK